MKLSIEVLRVVASALDDIDVGMCAFDPDDNTLLWNDTFLSFFPEHDGHVHAGEPYAANLRRFYLGRLSAEELPRIDRYIADGVARHRHQRRAFEFEHRGARLRVSSFEVDGFGRIRVWRKVEDLARPARVVPLEQRRSFDPATSHLLENIAEGNLVVDDADGTLWANQTFQKLYGLRQAGEAIGKRFEDIYRLAWKGSAHAAEYLRDLEQLSEHQRFSGAPYEIRLPGGRCVRVVEQRGSAADGRGYFLHVDITALKRQQEILEEAQDLACESEARYRLLAEYSSDVTVALRGPAISYVSPAVRQLLGWTPEEVVGKTLASFCHPDDLPQVNEAVRALKDGPQAEYQARVRRADGSHVWIEAKVRRSEVQGDGEPLLVTNVRNIDKRKLAEDQLAEALDRLQALAVTDALTGVANRRQFDEHLASEWRRASRDGVELALLMIDVDHFKAVNDTHGHQTGDEVLKAVATALRAFALRSGDLLARYGGEEFAILLPHMNVQAAAQMAERARAAVQGLDMRALGLAAGVTVSIGVAAVEASAPSASSDRLVRAADGALFQAKRAGRNRVSG